MARPGRPLDEGREEAILAATMALIEERGYDKLTVKDIAERAGAGLGAIYRRWPTKSAVVVAALRASAEEPPAEPGPCGAAEALGRALLHDATGMAACLPGLASALRHDPDLGVAVRHALIVPRQRVLATILAGELDDPAECELRAEMALGLLTSRMILGTAMPDEDEIRERIVPVVLGRPARPAPPLARTGRS